MIVQGFDLDHALVITTESPRDQTIASIIVQNVGDEVAKECKVYWYSKGEDSEATPDASVCFNLLPSEKKTVKLWSDVFTEPGVYESVIRVICSDCGFTFKREFPVIAGTAEGSTAPERRRE